ncbi:MAG: hypothetical protein H7263_11390, partial [Candidatus Sericytochromatia bacterium]|nr:hypothetical protein [Candidatus Sericytochromatia bacterium]
MNIAKYPYAISRLYKLIRKKESFFEKYFLMLDLFDAILKYLYYVSKNCLKNNVNDLNIDVNLEIIQSLIKCLALQNPDNLFIPELIKLKKNGLEKAIKTFTLEKNLAIDFSIEGAYKNAFENQMILIDSILDKLSFLNDYEVIVPYKVENEVLYFISIKKDLRIEKINVKQKLGIDYLYLKNKNNELLKLDKVNLSELFFRNKDEIQNTPEYLINIFHHFIIGSEMMNIKINFIRPINNLNTSELDTIDDIYIERDVINTKINDFIKNHSSGYLFIVGSLGAGKTTSINKYLANNYENNYFTRIKSNTDYNKAFDDIRFKFSEKNSIEFDKTKKIDHQSQFVKLINQMYHDNKRQIIIFDDIHLLDNLEHFLNIFPDKLPPDIYVFFTMSAREGLTVPKFFNKEIYYLPNFTNDEINKIYKKILPEINQISQEIINQIYKRSYGLPLYIIIESIKYINSFKDNYEPSLEFKNARYLTKITDNIEAKFKNVIEILDLYAEKYQTGLKNYGRYFFSLLAISKEGYNKIEIKNILILLPMSLIEHFIDKGGDFLLKVNSRYKLSAHFYEELCISLLSDDEIKFLNDRIIDFFEPWDKKVSSLSLKYLPYHYLKADRIKALKELLSGNFVKSKFKIYPKEMLEDFIMLINYFIDNNPENIASILKFCFAYQKLKEEYKKSLLNITPISSLNKESSNYNDIIEKINYINKNSEKFYQLLLISSISADNGNIEESRLAIKHLLEIPDIYINPLNSELIFRLCADISSAGVFDVINIPKTREDGIYLIKYLSETNHISKVLEVFIKLLDVITNEIDRSVLLEALISKASDFKNINMIEKVLKDALLLIEKINNINIKDRLYYIYISTVLKKRDLYDKQLNTILEIKDKLQTSLFKFLFYGNLSLIFLNMKQEKISKDFIFKGISFISDLENLSHQNFMFSSMILGFKYFEKTYYYHELIDYAFGIINDASFNYEKIERSLMLLNQAKKYDKTADILKLLIKDYSKINEKTTLPLLRPFFQSLNKIKDKRVQNPLLKKISVIAENENIEYKINFYSLQLLIVKPEESIFELLKSKLNFSDQQIKPEIILEIIINNVASFSNKDYSERLIELVLKNILFINTESLMLEVLIKLIDVIGKSKFAKAKEMITHIMSIKDKLSSNIDQLVLMAHETFFYANINELQTTLNLLHKIFSMLIKENDENKYLIVNEIYKNINLIKNNKINNQSLDLLFDYYVSDLLINTYKLFVSFHKEEFIVKIISDILTYITKTSYSEIKNVFYKILEITSRVVNANNRENIIGLIRFNLPIIDEKSYLIDILQKSILISEQNFSNGNIRLLSLIEIAALNEKFSSIDVSQRLIRSVIAELNFLNFEEYSSEVMIHISLILSKFSDKSITVELFKYLLSSENSIQTDKMIHDTYSSISYNLVKIGDYDLVKDIFNILFEKSFEIKKESIKISYLNKIVNNVTTFGLNEQNELFLEKVFSTRKFIQEEENKVSFFSSFIISLNKLNNIKILDYLFHIEIECLALTNNNLKNELLSILALAYFKYRDKEKSNYLFGQAINTINKTDKLDKKISVVVSLALKLISCDKQEQGKFLIEGIVSLINKVSDENARFDLFLSFITNLNYINNLNVDRNYLYDIFKSLIKFKNNIFVLRAYALLGETYFKLNQGDYSDYYFQQAIKNSLNQDTYEIIEFRINLGIILISTNNKVLGHEVLTNIINMIKNKPKRVFYELMIKLFSLVINLGEKKYSSQLYNQIIISLEKIP